MASDGIDLKPYSTRELPEIPPFGIKSDAPILGPEMVQESPYRRVRVTFNNNGAKDPGTLSRRIFITAPEGEAATRIVVNFPGNCVAEGCGVVPAEETFIPDEGYLLIFKRLFFRCAGEYAKACRSTCPVFQPNLRTPDFIKEV